eukprot:SAG31_NODE_2558_length_5489_cov_3.279777_3_plen_57_part_00
MSAKVLIYTTADASIGAALATPPAVASCKKREYTATPVAVPAEPNSVSEAYESHNR